MSVVIRRLGPGEDDRVRRAESLFDGPAKSQATRDFLSRAGHHLLVAYEGPDAVGFISGVETVHPDKGSEMLLYELAVAPASRRSGVGTELVRELAALAEARGCYGMWVLTDAGNDSALATYRGAGATEESSHVMLSWTFRDEASAGS